MTFIPSKEGAELPKPAPLPPSLLPAA